MTFRTLDPFPLALFPMGTHWLWHVFSAAAVVCLTAYVFRAWNTGHPNNISTLVSSRRSVKYVDKLSELILTSMEPKIPTYTRVLEYVENFLRLTKIFTRTLRGARSLDAMERAQGKLPNSTIHFAMTEWAGDILTTLNVHVEKVGQPSREEPVLFVGNHISYVDIPLLMFLNPVVFVAKKQLGSWPIIGAACRSVGTISSIEIRKHRGKAPAI